VSIRKIAKPHILELSPYQPGKPVEELERELGIRDSIKLASNENPHGPSPKAVAALHAMLDDIHRYPDGASFALRKELAGRLGVDPAQLVFGCGADEMLELIAKSFLGPGDECVHAWPSFAMYPIVAKGMGATPVPVPLDDDLVHDLDAIAAAITARTRVVILCNPNNPTGTSFGAEAFDRFIEALPEQLVLVVDEAYAEFARRDDFPDVLGWLPKRPGTVMLRTFSKLYGLAGLRVGYGVCDAELSGILERARHPFNVNRLAEVAALAALDDREHIARTLAANVEGVVYLARELASLGIRTWPTDANFLLAETGTDTYERLLREGVIVRPLAGFGMPGHIRITIGTAEENVRVVEALRRLREQAA
jgi:histidinol-phosphate aminotransferase